MKPIKFILFTILFPCMLACSSCFDESQYIAKYFNEVYQPAQMIQEENLQFPTEHFIPNLTWHCYQKNHLCQSSTLKMIAESYGIDHPLDFYSFLLGYTYSATYVKGAGMFVPFSDPEPGFILASNFLGLQRNYLITDDQQLLLDNIRYYLSNGFPVRIAWNSAFTMKYAVESDYFPFPEGWKEPSKKAFSPHSVVFVGYDSTSFYYYETHGLDFTLFGEKGIRIDNSAVAEAILSFSTNYRLPWKFMMTVLERDTVSINWDKILERNGEEMIGRVLGPTSTGSFAIKGLSDGVKKEGVKMFKSPIKEHFKETIETLLEIRSDNAIFVERAFSDNDEILEGSKLLHSAASNYKSIISILEKDNLERNDVISIRGLLDSSAMAEQKAGQIFISASEFMELKDNY